MTDDQINVKVVVDDHQLDDAQTKGEKVSNTIDFVEKKSKKAYRAAIASARAAWQIAEGVIMAMGGSISTEFKAVISAGFGMIQILTPILTAQSVSGWMSLQGILGLVELMTAITALASAQSQQSTLESDMRGVLTILNGVQSYIGSMSHLL